MAIYENTLRAETRMIDGIEIGRYSYAYKHSWSSGNYPGGRGRRVRLAETYAGDAAYKNRDVRFFIIADSFVEACKDGYYVFKIDREPPLSCSDLKGDAVGYISKVGGRFTFNSFDIRIGEIDFLNAVAELDSY